MLQSERRAAQAIDDVGEQVARVTERIEQRHDRAAADIAERLRQSEERTARLLDEARDRLAPGGAAPRTSAETDPPLKSTAAFGPELFSRVETEEEPAGPAETPVFAGADYSDDDEEAAAFAPIPEPDEDDIFGLDQPEPPKDPTEVEQRPLSTREVIDAARASARAADASRPKLQVKARHNWRAPPQPGATVFGALRSKPKTSSTLQTAFMIVGGAAALSVGAAGMVLINESGVRPETVETSPFGVPPRAAIAITPQPIGPTAPAPSAEVKAEVSTPPGQSLSEQFLDATRAIAAGKPGGLARLKSIAEAGYTPAQVQLAQLYENGQAGVVKNLGEARRWTQRAAEGGERMAMYNLGLDYFYGTGGPQDLPAAARWFRKAAEQGLTDAQYNLGMLYQAGSGVDRDLAEAYKWFSIAAEGGDAPARESAVSLEAKLSPTQLAAADKAARAFRPAGATSPELSLATARKVLGKLGYYKGPQGGGASPELKLALSAFQRDQGLAATGALDPVTASRLSVFTR
jgi:localization factor PodJL